MFLNTFVSWLISIKSPSRPNRPVKKGFFCKCCGKTFIPDICQPHPWKLYHEYGYGSKHDMKVIDTYLCSDCTDSLTDYIIGICNTDPMINKNPMVDT